MSREMLSQDEINALLKQEDLNNENNQPNGNELVNEIDLDQYLTPFDQDALGEIGNISFGSASTALSTLLGQKVEITTPRISAVLKDQLDKQFPKPHVAVHVEYTKGFKGINLFVIKSDDAKIIANLMMGGTGTDLNYDDDLTEMDISAVEEAMNQMMGSAATSMSTIFNTSVNISPPSVDILDITNGKGSESIPGEDIVVLVSFNLKVGTLINSNIMQLTSVSFAKEMINRLLGTEEEEEANEPEELLGQSSVEQQIAATDTQMNVVNNNIPIQEQNIQAQQQTSQIQNQTNQAQQMNQIQDQTNYQQQHYANSRSQSLNSNINIQPVQFSDLDTNKNIKSDDPNLSLLMDIPLQITVELGRTKKIIKDILEMSQGSILELDKLAGEPVDILANNKLIAKGEVVVIDENFGVRVTDIISQYERVRKLQ